MYECPASCDSLCRAVAGPCLRVLHPACSGLLLTAFTLQLAVPPDCVTRGNRITGTVLGFPLGTKLEENKED